MAEKQGVIGSITSINTYHTDAYAIAVKHGFEGTEEEWIASLKGEKGDKGDKGDFPESGVDYYTEEDKAEFVETVETELTGDIDKALDEILELQNEFLNGGENLLEEIDTRFEEINADVDSKLAEVNADIDGINADIDGINTEIDGIAGKIYPVGSIYMAVTDVSPASFLGGTWERLKDTFLLGAGDTYSNGTTGGSATHKLTVNNMSVDTMGIFQNKTGASVSGIHGTPNVSQSYAAGAYAVIQRSQAKLLGYTDTYEQPVNHMPPYLAVYMWKRTA